MIERPDFGNAKLIEQLKKSESMAEFEDALSELFIQSPKGVLLILFTQSLKML